MMFHVHKAYINSPAERGCLLLTHDIKRCLRDSQLQNGLIQIVSTQTETAVALLDRKAEVQAQILEAVVTRFENPETQDAKTKNSGDMNAVMAASMGLSLSLGFENQGLLINPHQDIIALDFDPKSGRREFIITAIGAGQNKQ